MRKTLFGLMFFAGLYPTISATAMVDLKMAVMDGRGQYSDGPMHVPMYSLMVAIWETNDVEGCAGYINGTPYTGDHSHGAYNGEAYNLPVYERTIFTIQCTAKGTGALIRDDVVVIPDLSRP